MQRVYSHLSCHSGRAKLPGESVGSRASGSVVIVRKGVAARTDKVSPEPRRHIAPRAIAARWAKGDETSADGRPV
jgi:hypothetical protein